MNDTGHMHWNNSEQIHRPQTNKTSFLFMRHGQSEANADGTFGDQNTPLTNLGHAQAGAAALILNAWSKSQNRLVRSFAVSSFVRAQQTAADVLENLAYRGNITTTTFENLHEWDSGVFSGKRADISDAFEEYWLRDEIIVRDAESRVLFDKRIWKVLEKVLNLEGLVLVLAHQWVFYAICRILGADRLMCPNAALFEFYRSDAQDPWSCRNINS